MSTEPLVSVITPFFNTARFLREAVESVRAQTYENWELFLVDDGSIDGSSEIAREHSRADELRVRYLEHPGHRNQGATVSRNLAIRHSAGKYLAFLDADDVWLPEKLRQQVDILEAHPEAVMVFGTPRYWCSWQSAEPPAADSIPALWTEPNAVVHPPQMLSASYPLGRGGAPCPSDLLVRRDCVGRVGGFEESFVGIYQLFEDQAFLAKIYLTGSVFVADRCWTNYRLHEQSCVAKVRRSGEYLRVRRYYLRWLQRHLKAVGSADGAIKELLASAMRRCDPAAVRWTYRQWDRVKRRVFGRVPLGVLRRMRHHAWLRRPRASVQTPEH